MNSGVCIKGSCYNDYNHDFYGLLGDILNYVRSDGKKSDLNEGVYQKDEASFNTQFDDLFHDLDNNTILVSGEYEEVNAFVDVKHNEKDDVDEGVEREDEETEEDANKDDDDDEDENEENEFTVLDDD
ncbi:PREDICTED: ciliogenesis-associated TTC17-interacting protein [Theobroma cacao]|uniref:Ciliogenesis-associated TTC17-interacting protein n=1 Tax=Theobroma cacao TaxID=3641 RepID=A0AB32W1T2_THECC|nr:PREDICTED: ciliogenesis-associated TTC17-interacting protein [Theobroma cacao]